jgi:two-component system NtrC family response regulator
MERQLRERTLLIVEDDRGLQSQMRWCFDDVAAEVAGDRAQALTHLKNQDIKVVTLDLGLPPDPGGTSEGFALLTEIRNLYPWIKVIVVTGLEEREHALWAMREGAYDYHYKPVDARTLAFAADRAFFLAELEQELTAEAEQNSSGTFLLPRLIGRSSVMQAVAERVKRIAPTDVTVLVTGETGTGKEIIASNVHALSRRAERPLVTINCAAIPENLLESELFGHEKGSFTGAHARKIGKLEAANGGTLFLDEIGDMPFPLQAKILRFLQERTFERIGSNQSIQTDVRVISATHRNLNDMIAAGTFREDLFYRLSEIDIDLPPLRDRGSDVLLIAEAILHANRGDKPLRLSSAAVDAIGQAEWSGNVRELENCIRKAVILADAAEITVEDLGLDDNSESGTDIEPLKLVRARAESDAILAALQKAGHNLSEAARLLQVSRPTLYGLLEKYNIEHG